LERQLASLRRFNGGLRAHRSLLLKLDTQLQELKDELFSLHTYLLHTPVANKKYSAGKVLGVVAELAQRLVPEKPRDSHVLRRVASVQPEPTRKRGGEEKKRSASMDSVLTFAVPHPMQVHPTASRRTVEGRPSNSEASPRRTPSTSRTRTRTMATESPERSDQQSSPRRSWSSLRPVLSRDGGDSSSQLPSPRRKQVRHRTAMLSDAELPEQQPTSPVRPVRWRSKLMSLTGSSKRR